MKLKKPTVTTVRVAGERKKAVEYVALQAGNKCGKLLKVSDVMHFLIDRYCNPETINELAAKYTTPIEPYDNKEE